MQTELGLEWVDEEQLYHELAGAEMSARLSDGFILLAPTSRFLDGEYRELLLKARAGVFDLESNSTLLPSGLLHARQPAGELFAPFMTAGAVMIEDTAR